MIEKMKQTPEDRIFTNYDPKPIPNRRFDWCAWDDSLGADTCCGYGATEQDAIEDLHEQLDMRKPAELPP